jgi:hypothetical protein
MKSFSDFQAISYSKIKEKSGCYLSSLCFLQENLSVFNDFLFFKPNLMFVFKEDLNKCT